MLDRLEEIKALGVTAVMLTPITLGGPGLGPMGRAPYSFFAPEPSFATASDPAAACEELKQLVRGLHEAGLEIILQVAHQKHPGKGSWLIHYRVLLGMPLFRRHPTRLALIVSKKSTANKAFSTLEGSEFSVKAVVSARLLAGAVLADRRGLG